VNINVTEKRNVSCDNIRPLIINSGDVLIFKGLMSFMTPHVLWVKADQTKSRSYDIINSRNFIYTLIPLIGKLSLGIEINANLAVHSV
jgi:hypothetical protein